MKSILVVLFFVFVVVFAANCGLASTLFGLWKHPLTSDSVNYEEFHFNDGNTYIKLAIDLTQYVTEDNAMDGCEYVTSYEDGTYTADDTTITFNRARISSEFIQNCDDATKDTSPEYTPDVFTTRATYTISGNTLTLDSTEYAKE